MRTSLVEICWMSVVFVCEWVAEWNVDTVSCHLRWDEVWHKLCDLIGTFGSKSKIRNFPEVWCASPSTACPACLCCLDRFPGLFFPVFIPRKVFFTKSVPPFLNCQFSKGGDPLLVGVCHENICTLNEGVKTCFEKVMKHVTFSAHIKVRTIERRPIYIQRWNKAIYIMLSEIIYFSEIWIFREWHMFWYNVDTFMVRIADLCSNWNIEPRRKGWWYKKQVKKSCISSCRFVNNIDEVQIIHYRFDLQPVKIPT